MVHRKSLRWDLYRSNTSRTSLPQIPQSLLSLQSSHIQKKSLRILLFSSYYEGYNLLYPRSRAHHAGHSLSWASSGFRCFSKWAQRPATATNKLSCCTCSNARGSSMQTGCYDTGRLYHSTQLPTKLIGEKGREEHTRYDIKPGRASRRLEAHRHKILRNQSAGLCFEEYSQIHQLGYRNCNESTCP